MKVFINGEAADCEIGLTIEQLLHRYALPLETTLVEHNGVALRRREWPQHSLGENDRIEILRVAAGG